MRFVSPVLIFLSSSLIFSLLLAQAPPEVEQALRTRVSEFYQLQVDHKFRQAEQLIAEDSKDFYYESKKPDLKSFSIKKIEYSPDFQKAKVTISTKAEIMFPGTGPVLMDVNVPGNWKLEDGKWCWFIDKEALLETPFGKVKAPSDGAESDPRAMFQAAASGQMQHAVTADREQIQLDPAHPKPEAVTLKNVLPGPVTLKVMTSSPGLKVTIAKPQLAAGESTQATIVPVENAPARPDKVVLAVTPVQQTVTIAIKWASLQ